MPELSACAVCGGEIYLCDRVFGACGELFHEDCLRSWAEGNLDFFERAEEAFPPPRVFALGAADGEDGRSRSGAEEENAVPFVPAGRDRGMGSAGGCVRFSREGEDVICRTGDGGVPPCGGGAPSHAPGGLTSALGGGEAFAQTNLGREI